MENVAINRGIAFVGSDSVIVFEELPLFCQTAAMRSNLPRPPVSFYCLRIIKPNLPKMVW